MPAPIPIPDELSKPFWDAADRKQLVAQRCRNCGRYQHPPQKTCASCASRRMEWAPLSGRGVIYSYSVMHDSRVRLLQAQQPFTILTVQAEESPDLWFLSTLPGVQLGKIDVGDPVAVDFEEVAPGRYIPQFKPIGHKSPTTSSAAAQGTR